MKKYLLFIALILISLVMRLYLTDKGWHVDMLSNAGWGEWIYTFGTAKFYENNVWTYSWPTQPPLINTVYAFNKKMFINTLGRLAWIDFEIKKYSHLQNVPWLSDFVQWYGYGKINTEIPFQIGYMVTMKFFPIMADLLIGIVIFYVTGKKLAWPLLYLMSPFSWYLSSLWGQYDQVGFLLILGAFLLIKKNAEFLAPTLAAAAVLIKPTSLILLPFFAYWYLRKGNKNIGLKIAGVLLPLAFFWMTTRPYTYKNPFIFAKYDLVRIIFEKSEPRVSVNAFNFWRILIGDSPRNQSMTFLFVPTYIWSFAVFSALNLLAIYKAETEKHNKNCLWECLFIVAAGSWLFMTGMLERYLFAGMTFGLLAVVTNPGLLKYWMVMSIIFWMNLFYHWWFPAALTPLQNLLLWNDGAVTRLLALLNTGLFLIIAVNFVRLPRLIPANFQKSLFRPFQMPKAEAGTWLPKANRHK
jgi:Gpi18-like mannosyltransferase